MNNKRVKLAIATIVVSGSAAIGISQFTSSHEGRRYVAYQDSGGVWTVCDGHTKTVKHNYKYSDAECDALHKEDIDEASAIVNRHVKVELNLFQRAALVDFVFNLGEGKFKKSTLLKLINEKKYDAACDELLKWNKGRVNGNLVVLKGLDTRRKEERELCLNK